MALKSIRRGSLFTKLLLTYGILFTALCLLFSLALLRQALDRDRSIRSQEAHGRMELLGRMMDERFTDLDKIGTQLAHLDWVKRARSTSDVFAEDIDLIQRRKICGEMLTYQSIVRVTRSMALLLPHKHMAIDSVSFWDEQAYLTSIGIGDHAMADILARQPSGALALLPLDDASFLALKQLDYADDPQLVLMAYVDGAYLADLIPANMRDGISYFHISTDDGVLYARGRRSASATEAYAAVIPSSLFGWDYAFELRRPPSTGFPEALLWAALVLASCAVGFALAYALGRMSYKPVGELLARLGISDARQPELAAIEQLFLSMREERQNFESLSRRYYGAARDNLLLILLGGLFDETITEETLRTYGLPFNDDLWYMVALLTGRGDGSERARLLRFVELQAAVTERMEGAHLIQLADQGYALVVASESGGEAAREALGERIRGMLREAVPGALDITESALHPHLVGIGIAYQEAKATLGGDDLLPASAFAYPEEWEHQLAQALRDGRRSVAERVLSELQRINAARALSAAQFAQGMGRVLDTLCEGLSCDARAAREALMRAPGQEAQWGVLLDVLRRGLSDPPDIDASMEMGARIVRYVDDNLFDGNLSQQSIAMEFGLSRPMISKLFKRAAGENFIDYVHRGRVERAKALLRAGNRNIPDVGRLVGCESEITLRRAFLRLEGVTPMGFVKMLEEGEG